MRFYSAAVIAALAPLGYGFQLHSGPQRTSLAVAPRNSPSSTQLFSSSVAEESSMGTASTNSPQPSEPDMQAYSNGYKTAFNEISCALAEPSFGSLPNDLVGTYYRCGPAMFSAGSLPPPANSLVKPKQPPVPDGQDPSRMVLHPFDGDGAVLAITFHGDKKKGEDTEDGEPAVDTAGKVTTRFRYVRTNAFTNERKKGKKLYTGMESTRSTSTPLGNDLPLPFYQHHLLPGLNKLRKNTSNTRADALSVDDFVASMFGRWVRLFSFCGSFVFVDDILQRRVPRYGQDQYGTTTLLRLGSLIFRQTTYWFFK